MGETTTALSSPFCSLAILSAVSLASGQKRFGGEVIDYFEEGPGDVLGDNLDVGESDLGLLQDRFAKKKVAWRKGGKKKGKKKGKWVKKKAMKDDDGEEEDEGEEDEGGKAKKTKEDMGIWGTTTAKPKGSKKAGTKGDGETKAVSSTQKRVRKAEDLLMRTSSSLAAKTTTKPAGKGFLLPQDEEGVADESGAMVAAAVDPDDEDQLGHDLVENIENSKGADEDMVVDQDGGGGDEDMGGIFQFRQGGVGKGNSQAKSIKAGAGGGKAKVTIPGEAKRSPGVPKGDCDETAKQSCKASKDCDTLYKSVKCVNDHAFNCRMVEHWKKMVEYQTFLNKQYANQCGYDYKAINCFVHIEWIATNVTITCQIATVNCDAMDKCTKLDYTEQCVKRFTGCCQKVSKKIMPVVRKWKDNSKCRDRESVTERNKAKDRAKPPTSDPGKALPAAAASTGVTERAVAKPKAASKQLPPKKTTKAPKGKDHGGDGDERDPDIGDQFRQMDISKKLAKKGADGGGGGGAGGKAAIQTALDDPEISELYKIKEGHHGEGRVMAAEKQQ